MHIGIFDSGQGGAFVAEQLRALRPDDTFTIIDDHRHVPYGSLDAAEINRLTFTAIQRLLEKRCDVIVIACNTATAVSIEGLRSTYPEQKFVGFEPMIKPASLMTKSKKIAILATPATIASERYQNLKKQWAHDIKVIEPDCSSWALQIEQNAAITPSPEETVQALISQGVDTIALACTHYLKLEDQLKKTADNRAAILSPVASINQQIDRLGS